MNEFTDMIILSYKNKDENMQKINYITYSYVGNRADYYLTRSESAQNDVIQDLWTFLSCEIYFNFAEFLKRIKFSLHEIDKLFKAKMLLDISLSKFF